MAGKAERQMAVDCREKFPDLPDRFSASHGAINTRLGAISNVAGAYVQYNEH